MSTGRIIAWLLVPYIMVFVDWKRSHVLLRIYGGFSAFFVFFFLLISVIVAATMDEMTTEKPKPTVEVKKEPAKPKVLTAEEKEKKRKEQYKKCFSPWDGSHTNLKYYIEDNMNDPDSFEHVETVYYDYTAHLIVETTFRGNNQFGALVKNTVKAQVTADSKCTVIKIIDQW
jgi:Na+-transporting methylmalonyl-CoA/oxaloacetate decarboxylase gamma subunit